MAKIRLVYKEDKQGKAISYFHVERSEAHRIAQILKILPELKGWTPLQKIASRINADRISTESTIFKLLNVSKVDVKIFGHIKVLAKHPLIDIRKDEFNPRNNQSNTRFLRPRISIRMAHC